MWSGEVWRCRENAEFRCAQLPGANVCRGVRDGLGPPEDCPPSSKGIRREFLRSRRSGLCPVPSGGEISPVHSTVFCPSFHFTKSFLVSPSAGSTFHLRQRKCITFCSFCNAGTSLTVSLEANGILRFILRKLCCVLARNPRGKISPGAPATFFLYFWDKSVVFPRLAFEAAASPANAECD